MAIETATVNWDAPRYDFSEQELESIKQIERARDIELAVSACQAVFKPELGIDEEKQGDVCQHRIQTLRNMWLPKDYTERQVDVYAEANELYARSHDTLNKEVRQQLRAAAAATLTAHEALLSGDPVVIAVRDEATAALYAGLDDAYKEMFARVTRAHDVRQSGVESEPTFAITPELPGPTRSEFSFKKVGRQILDKLIVLRPAAVREDA